MATTTTETTSAEGGHAPKAGMPQLDTTTWVPQLFWLAVTFIALYMVVSRIVIPKTGGVIAKRKATVEGDLAAAQALKADSDKAVEAYEQSLAAARAKASGIAQENRNALGSEIDGERAKLDAALSAKAAEADKRISAAKSKALSSVKGVAADIARDIAIELTSAKITRKAAADAVAKIK
ncbi:MAG: F0F1 ATP synthase subunit B' [Aestuariivirga sp.]